MERLTTIVFGLLFGLLGLFLYSLGGIGEGIGGLIMVAAAWAIIGTIIATINRVPTTSQRLKREERIATEDQITSAISTGDSQLLLTLLDADDVYIQSLAAEGLGKLKNPEIVTPVIGKIKEGIIHAGLMKAAFDGLGKHPVEPLLKELESRALDHPATLVAADMLCAQDELSKEAIRTIIDSLIQVLRESEHKQFYRRAANKLGEISGEKLGTDVEAWDQWRQSNSARQLLGET